MVDSPFYMLPDPGNTPDSEYQGAWANLDTTALALMRARFSSSWRTNPTISIYRSGELDSLMTGTKLQSVGMGRGAQLRRVPAPEYDSPLMSIQEANAQYGIKQGEQDVLSFSEPIRQKAAQYLHDLKMAELRDTDYETRARGFFKNAAGLGAGFVANAIDPINIGVSMIPVAAPLRAAMLARGFGLGTTRLVAGAAEGLFGAAAVEPFVYYGAQKAHLDYTLDDSLLNMAFGAGLGGGLHWTIGKMGDFMKKVTFDTRMNMLRTAVNQLTSEQPVRNMETLLAADRKVFDARNASPSDMKQSTLTLFDNLGQDTPEVDFKKGMRFVPGKKEPFQFSKETGDFGWGDPTLTNKLEAAGFDNPRVKGHLADIGAGRTARVIEENLRRLGLKNSDIEKAAAGIETLAMITKDKVIKITKGKFGEEFPGLTARVLFSKKIGGYTLEVGERVKTIEDLANEARAKGDKRDLGQIMDDEGKKIRNELAFELGLRRLIFHDDHNYNIGRRMQDGKAVILDRGGGEGIGPLKVDEGRGKEFFDKRKHRGVAMENWLRGFRQADQFQPPVSGAHELDQAYFEHLNDLAIQHQYDPNNVPKIWGFGDEDNALINLKPEPLPKDNEAQVGQLNDAINNVKELLQRFGFDEKQLGRVEEQANKPVKLAQALKKGIQQAAACVAGGF